MSAIAEFSDPVLDVVERTWGFSSLRPMQRDAIDAVLAGRDSLLVVPTGAGKSLCYQAPALLADGVIVVVSPLIALMKDQVDALTAVGVKAGALNSTTSPAAQRAIERDVVGGTMRLLFVSPERLAGDTFRAFLKRARVRAFAIDEAHCISHWGHDFRPEYRQLRELRDLFPHASIHAFTATATEQVRADVCAQLRLKDTLVLVGDLDRPNLRYRVIPRMDEAQQVDEVIRRHPGEAGIVYCIRRKDVDALAGVLASRGYKAVAYHAGLSPDERRDAQEAFASERVDIVVATVAFGMGIDRSNVRFVVHSGMPKSIEHYQQEAGRAGRDGLLSECVLLYDGNDRNTWARLLQQSVSDEAQLNVALLQLEAMHRFALAAVCRHRALVEHFGGHFEPANCGACDVCLGEIDAVPDSSTIAQKILSCVVRLGQAFGSHHVAAVLRGERTAKLLQWHHERLSTFGLLPQYTREEIRAWIAQLVADGALRQDGGLHPILRLGSRAKPILRGEVPVRLSQPSSRVTADGSDEWTGVDRDLFEALRGWRMDEATRRGIAAFVIFGDRTLRCVAAVRPSTMELLRRIDGIGDRRLDEHGAALLAIVDEQCAARGLTRDQAAPARPAPRLRTRAPRMTPTRSEGQRLFLAGATVDEVMARTGRARSTCVLYLCELIEEGGWQPDLRQWMSAETERSIRDAARQCGTEFLKPIKEMLGETVSYDDIHLVVSAINAAGVNCVVN